MNINVFLGDIKIKENLEEKKIQNISSSETFNIARELEEIEEELIKR